MQCEKNLYSIFRTEDLIKAKNDGLSIEYTGRLEFIQSDGNIGRYRYSGYESADLSSDELNVRIPESTEFVVWYSGKSDGKKIFALNGAGLFINFVRRIQ